MIMIYIHTKFHTSLCNCSVLIIKRRTKYRIHGNAMSLFYILQKYAL